MSNPGNQIEDLVDQADGMREEIDWLLQNQWSREYLDRKLEGLHAWLGLLVGELVGLQWAIARENCSEREGMERKVFPGNTGALLSSDRRG